MNETQTESIEEKMPSHDEKQSHIRKNKQKRIQKIVLGLLSVSIFFILTTVYSQYQVHVLKKLSAANEITHPDVPVTPNQIIEALARHMILPDTAPQIASVEDSKKLVASQPFFKDVVNGDVVVVYDTEIIVYRPSQDIIVAVGSVGGASKDNKSVEAQ